MFVTARTKEQEGLLQEIADALTSLDLDANVDDQAVVVDGARIAPHLMDRAHPTPADLAAFVEAAPGRLPAMVVADRISDAGRDVLRRAGWGWLDRRGHLRMWAPGVRIETVLGSRGSGRRPPADPWTTVGLEIALAALIEPAEPVTARRIAARIGRSAGATHELIARFAEVGLIGPKSHRPLLPELFWETAARWPDDGWIALPVELSALGERIDPNDLIRVDERAATLGGARITAAGDMPARAYVVGAASLRRARALASSGEPTRCWIRQAPIRWLPENPDHPADADHPWKIAHPLICALRLAADPSRGREIVEGWGIVPDPDNEP